MQVESNASAARSAVAGQAGADLAAQRPMAEPSVQRSPTWVRHHAWRQTTAQAAAKAAPGMSSGWLGRLRHALQGGAQRAQSSSDARLAALSLVPVRGHAGFGVLRTLGGLSLRLQASVASMKAQQAALADAQALARVTTAVQQRLAAAAGNADRFNATLRQAFGDQFDATQAEALRQQALAGDFSWAPKIQIATARQLADLSGTQSADGAARGCYVQAEDTIYIAAETLHGDADTAQRLLMEEMGHAIDARINTSDAVGDEGEIFSKLMNGDAVTAQQMAEMKADNDHGTVQLNGRSVQVEYGWFKKLVKAVTSGIKKVVGAVVKGVVSVAKSAVKVSTGLMTLNFSRVAEGFKEGVQAVVTTVKTVAKAVKDTTKAVLKLAKEAFQKLMQSKLFAAVLMICRFIPIPVVQLVVRIVDIVRAAYMAYQGIKNKSWGAVLGAVASVAGGAANVAGSLGASAATVANIQAVADAASKLSTAYNAIANKDIGAALSLAGGAFGSNSPASSTIQTLQTVGGYAQQAMALRSAVRSGDALGALSGTLGLAGGALGKDGGYAGQIATASEVVTGLRAAQALSQGRLDAAQSLAGSMDSAQAASREADAISARRQAEADAAAEAQAQAEAAAAAAAARAAAEAAPGTAAPTADKPPAELGNGNAYVQGLQASGLPVSDDLASQDGTSAGAAAQTRASPATAVISRGDTLEAIARANYGDNWKAGLARMALDNNLRLNQWGSPVLQPGKELVLNDLSAQTADELASLSRLGGKLIANNSNGLAVKAELEQRAREAAAAKIAEAQAAARQAVSWATAPAAGQPGGGLLDSGLSFSALSGGAQASQATGTIVPDPGYLAALRGIAGSDLSLSQKLGMAWDNTKYYFRGSDTAQGTVQVVGGGLEVAGAAGLTSTGLGTVVAVPLAAHGGDNIGTGLNRIFGNGDGQTLTYQGVRSLTDSDTAARLVDQGIPLVGGVASFASGLRAAEAQVMNNTAYRALNAADRVTLEETGGLLAKAPNGAMTAEQHVLNATPLKGGAQLNSPWISTTRNFSVADQGYNGGNGVVAINLSKVPVESQVEVWKTLPRSSIYAESKAYHRSIWAQEVTIHQSIPAAAVYTPFNPVSQVSVLPIAAKAAATGADATRDATGGKP